MAKRHDVSAIRNTARVETLEKALGMAYGMLSGLQATAEKDPALLMINLTGKGFARRMSELRKALNLEDDTSELTSSRYPLQPEGYADKNAMHNGIISESMGRNIELPETLAADRDGLVVAVREMSA